MLRITLGPDDKNKNAMSETDVMQYYEEKAHELNKNTSKKSILKSIIGWLTGADKRASKRMFFTEEEKKKHQITEDKGFIIIGGRNDINGTNDIN